MNNLVDLRYNYKSCCRNATRQLVFLYHFYIEIKLYELHLNNDIKYTIRNLLFTLYFNTLKEIINDEVMQYLIYQVYFYWMISFIVDTSLR